MAGGPIYTLGDGNYDAEEGLKHLKNEIDRAAMSWRTLM